MADRIPSLFPSIGLTVEERAANRRKRISEFAEALAEHGKSLKATSRMLGIAPQTGHAYFRQIKKDLGPQAV